MDEEDDDCLGLANGVHTNRQKRNQISSNLTVDPVGYVYCAVNTSCFCPVCFRLACLLIVLEKKKGVLPEFFKGLLNS